MNKTQKTNIIVQAFLSKIISDEWVELNSEELRHLCQYVDFNKIPDRTIADNEVMHDMIPWESFDRMKIIRVVARNVRIADYVDLSKYNYTIREAREMLRIRPHLIDKINIDLEKMNHEEAFCLLTIGAEELSEKVDVSKYEFTAKEKFEIIEFNEFADGVIRSFDLSNLKDYHVCDMIINTGDIYFQSLDLNKLTARKWIEILENRPELLCYCNFLKFIQSDIYNSVELICLFPDENFDYLIKERNYKEELSAFGWEKLIINKPGKYINECCFWKLNETNWKNIVNVHPQLITYKT